MNATELMTVVTANTQVCPTRSMMPSLQGHLIATAIEYAALTRPASTNDPVDCLTRSRVAKAPAANGNRPMVAPISGIRTPPVARMRL